MKTDERRVAFVKALVAAAWADGELHGLEIKTITEYLQRFEITAAEYQELKPLLEQRMKPDEARELLEQQLTVLSSEEERSTLMAAIRDLLVTEDDMHPEAGRFLDDLKQLVGQQSSAQLFVSRLRTLWARAPVPPARNQPGRQQPAAASFFQRRFLEYYRRQITITRAKAGLALDEVSDRDLYRTVIWAGLLARVAEADKNFCKQEEERLIDYLSVAAVAADVPRPDLAVVVRTYRDTGLASLNLQFLVKEFAQFASKEDFTHMLDGLFMVAAADGKLTDEEIRAVREIALNIGFPEAVFRKALQRCKRRMAEGWN
jgi:uncharacterized tellurite resistance protein B-like protein